MIELNSLKEIFEKYGISYEKVISKCESILEYDKYDEMENVIKYLLEDLNVGVKNIEKSPSVLCSDVLTLKSNVEFLSRTDVIFSNVANCLSVLSVDPLKFRETYDYIRDNYGVSYINKTNSILGVDAERIKQIEKFGLSKEATLSAAIYGFSLSSIERVIKTCHENNVEITGSVFKSSAKEIKDVILACRRNNIDTVGNVFQRSADEIESVVSICRENNMEVTGSMFLKKPDEVKKIIPLCRKFGIEATGSIFLRKASQLQDSIDFIMENYDDSYLKNSIVVRDSKHLSKVFPYLEELGVLEVVRESASILSLKLDEIKERKAFIDSIGNLWC